MSGVLTSWNLESLLAINAILGGAAFIASLSGFGYALVGIPFLVLLFPPDIAVPVIMISWLPLAALLTWEARSGLSGRQVGYWLIGGAGGLPLGVYALAHIDETTMQALIGALTLLAAMALWFKPGKPFKKELVPSLGAGLISGIMGGASGMSGPPVVLFGINQGWDKERFRANVVGYIAALNLLTLIMFRKYGMLDAPTLVLGVSALPGIILGYVGGMRCKDRLQQEQFRKLAFVLVAFGGIGALVW
tara:strand:- start:234 stop:977 length:744 start_codon:yes stop_codon:yes gene_type:complete